MSWVIIGKLFKRLVVRKENKSFCIDLSTFWRLKQLRVNLSGMSATINPLANPKGVKKLCELCQKPAKHQCTKCLVTFYWWVCSGLCVLVFILTNQLVFRCCAEFWPPQIINPSIGRFRVRIRGEVRVRQSGSDFNEGGNNLAGRKWAQHRPLKYLIN